MFKFLDDQMHKAAANRERIDRELDKAARRSRVEDPSNATLAGVPLDMVIRYHLDDGDDGHDFDESDDPVVKFFNQTQLDRLMGVKPEPVSLPLDCLKSVRDEEELEKAAERDALQSLEKEMGGGVRGHLERLLAKGYSAQDIRSVLSDGVTPEDRAVIEEVLREHSDGAPLHKRTALHQSQHDLRAQIDEFCSDEDRSLLDKALAAMDFSCFTELVQRIIQRVKLERAAA